MVDKGHHPVALYSPVQWSCRSTLHSPLLHFRRSTLHCFPAVAACLAPTYKHKKRWGIGGVHLTPVQRRPSPVVGKRQHPVALYSPVQRSCRSTLHCFTAVAPLLRCRRSTALLLSLPISLLCTAQRRGRIDSSETNNAQICYLKWRNAGQKRRQSRRAPNWIWEARKVRVGILGVNDQGTELFSHVVQELVGFGVLAQQSF